MTVFLLPAVLGGLLGLLPWRAADGDYLAAMRVACLGAALLGHLGLAVFVWRKSKGAKRVFLLLLLLPVLRLDYRPSLELAQVFAGWVDGVGRAAGAGRLDLPVHASLFGALAFLCALFAAAALHAVTHKPSLLTGATALAFVLFGWAAFAAPADRALPEAISPHFFREAAPLPRADDPNRTYGDVVADGERPWRTRAMAALAFARRLLTPDEGWAGAVSHRRLQAFRADPDASMLFGLTALETGWVEARRQLRPDPGDG